MSSEMLKNIALVAHRLHDLGIRDAVYVGGATIGLLVTDEAASPVRPTVDVDVVTPTRTRSAYHAIEATLRKAGYEQPIGEGIPICRWIIDGVQVDVMPLDEAILGFSNRWYSQLVKHAELRELPDGTTIRVASAPYVMATKLEAFKGRGRGDYQVSHDLEDIIILVDGRPELATEIFDAPIEVRAFIGEEVARLLSNTEFMYAIQGYLDPDEASQARESIVRERLEKIRDLSQT